MVGWRSMLFAIAIPKQQKRKKRKNTNHKQHPHSKRYSQFAFAQPHSQHPTCFPSCPLQLALFCGYCLSCWCLCLFLFLVFVCCLCWLSLLVAVTVVSYCYYHCHCLLFFFNFDVNVNDNGSCGCHVNANVNVNWILGSSSSTPSAKLVRCQPSDAVFGRCYCSFDVMAICVSWYSFEDPHQQLFSSSHMSSTFLSTSLSSSTRRM